MAAGKHVRSVVRTRWRPLALGILGSATFLSGTSTAQGEDVNPLGIGISAFVPIPHGFMSTHIATSSGGLIVDYTLSSRHALRLIGASVTVNALEGCAASGGSCASSASERGRSVDALVQIGANLDAPGWYHTFGAGLHSEKWQTQISRVDTQSGILSFSLGHRETNSTSLEVWAHYYTGAAALDFAFGLALVYQP